MTVSMKERTEKPDIKEFSLGKQLGEGNFSRILIATCKETKETFALKVIEKQKIHRLRVRHPNIFNEINMEKEVLNRLRHPNIIRLYQTFQDQNCLYFLLEFIEGGELLEHMLHEERQVGFNEETAKFYAADIVNALQYMYEMKIVHRDLKPENMVVCKKDGHLRIVDFGTAKNLADTSLNGPNFVGTPEYMSPETIDNKSVSYTADYWAFGCILYQFLTGETPFAGGSMYLTFLKAQEATNYTFPSFLSEEAKDLIQKLLQKDPTKRPTIEEIKAHPFFDGIDFKNHMSKPRPLVLSHDPKYFSLVKEFAATNSTSTLSTSSTTPTSPSCSVVSSQTSTGIHHFQDGLQDRIMNFASASEKHLLMHLLKRKQILHLETVYPRFFRTPGLGRCRYATNRSYVGLTHDLQNEWNQSFEVVQITGPSIGSENGLKIFEETIEIINQRNPLPYVVVINGNFIQASPEEQNEERYQSQADTFHTLVARFDPSIRLVLVPGTNAFGHTNPAQGFDKYTENFGDSFYSFWIAGVKYIVLNSTLAMCHQETLKQLYEEQEKWLLKELENGKICARAMCVLSHHAIYQVPSVSNPFFPVADNTEVAAPDRFEENKSNVTCSSSSVQETASLPKIYLDLVVQNRTRVIFSTHRTLNKVVRIEKEKSKATNKQKKIIKKQSEGEDNSSSDDDEEEKDVCDQVLSGTINSIAVLQVVKFSKSTTNGIIDFETIHSTTLTKKNNTSSKKKDKPTPEENEMISPISPAAFVNKLEI